MTTHRWVADVRVPIKVMQNEDKHVFVRVRPDKEVLTYPMRIWCYDCDIDLAEGFGQECTGFLVPGEKDSTISDEEWEAIP